MKLCQIREMCARRLPKAFEIKLFSTKEALAAGLTKYDLLELIKTDQLIKISRGYYQNPEHFSLDSDDLFEKAVLQVGKPCCICLVSALNYYDLTDLLGKKTWVIVPVHLRRRSTELRVVRMRKPNWNIGITKEPKFWITDIDRTLVECLIYERLIGINTGMEAIKRALKEKKTSLNNIYSMGKKLGVSHRIMAYMKALS